MTTQKLPARMRVMRLDKTGRMVPGGEPLNSTVIPCPRPGVGEVLLKVLACGVCHTELDEIEGRLAPAQLPVTPGHEVVGRVIALGDEVASPGLGTRVGVGWIHCSDGTEHENLSPQFRATGHDVDGGYAEYMTVPAAYAVPVPEAFSDVEAAPLLCAGAIGYRALRLTGMTGAEPLGLMGFGGSAHLVLQLARHLYPNAHVHVFARSDSVRRLALELGAASTGDIDEAPPLPLRSIIDTTPAWQPVLSALNALAPGGRLVINAIRKEPGDQQALLDLSYHQHLWMEREIKSVANITRADIAGFLPLAARAGLRARVETYPLSLANQALNALRFEPVHGAKVLVPGD